MKRSSWVCEIVSGRLCSDVIDLRCWDCWSRRLAWNYSAQMRIEGEPGKEASWSANEGPLLLSELGAGNVWQRCVSDA